MQTVKMMTGFALAAALVGFCGCATTSPAPAAAPVVEPPPYVPMVNTYTTVGAANAAGVVNFAGEVLDAQFAQYLPVREFRLGRSNDGLGTATVALKNATASMLRVRYRFDWLDATGAIVEDVDNQSWEKRSVSAGGDVVLKSLAPSKACVAYKLSIKYILPEAE